MRDAPFRENAFDRRTVGLILSKVFEADPKFSALLERLK